MFPNPPAQEQTSAVQTSQIAEKISGRLRDGLSLERLPAFDGPPAATCPSLHFSRLIGIPRPLALWHLASFDAPSVAVVWSVAFAWAAGAHLPLWVPVLLALTLWAVYIGDRLLDARSGFRSAQSEHLHERHYFHWRHRRILLPLAVTAACSAGLLILIFMPFKARVQDSLLAAGFLAYFARVHSMHKSRRLFFSRLFSKELLVGMLFTIGCALPALRLMTAALRPMLWVVGFFALLAWFNCRAIDSWESNGLNSIGTDPTAKAESGQAWAAMRTGLYGSLLACFGFVLAAWLYASFPRPAMLLLAGSLSALLLAWLDRRQSRMTVVALRTAADLVLLTPALLIPLAWLAR
jgi:hypothetical protein